LPIEAGIVRRIAVPVQINLEHQTNQLAREPEEMAGVK